MRSLVIAALAVTLAACSGGSKGAQEPPLTVGVGGCCGDPNSCRANICGPTLHCGNAQTPISVYTCCENGAFCCRSDDDCQPYFPGGKCDTARSSCFTSCATEDDTHCRAGYHCEVASCVADLPDFSPTACDEASDCASRNCAVAFDPTAATSFCAPAGKCGADGQGYDPGFTLCSGNAYARRCDAAGAWSAPTYNPQLAGQTCDAGGGAASGFMDAATCTSGVNAQSPGFHTACQSCLPYRATASGCLTSCATNDDTKCWSGYHCDANSTCKPNIASGLACTENSDCVSGWCNNFVCADTLDNSWVCGASYQCKSGNCSEEFDPNTTTRTCAPASSCAKGGIANAIGANVCNAGASNSTYSRTCQASGDWANAVSAVTGACYSSTYGSNGGYYTATCSASTGLQNVCNPCYGYAPASASSCSYSCTSDAMCASLYFCNLSSCVARKALGVACAGDNQCQSGRCNVTCLPKLGDGSACGKASDCISGMCGGAPAVCYSFKASCPYVFSWDGGAYHYETDVQGPIIGNARFSSRIKLYSPEYVMLDALQPDLLGDYRVKLRETLPEIDYVDQVTLLVVDLPQGYELFDSSSEDTYRMGSVAPFTLFTAKDPISPITATDQTGADILSTVLYRDEVTAPAKGVMEPIYTFDFGTIANQANAKLLIDGWALIGPEYANATSLVSYIEVVDPNGAWVKARDFGFPSGDLKPMAISLAGMIRHPTDHRIRVHMGRAPNSRWVIDRVRLDTSAPVTVDVVAELSPETAELRERGALTNQAPSYVNRLHAQDDTQALLDVALSWGSFTRLGDVAPLLLDMDDTYVVMRHGDELEMTFPGGLPSPAPGAQRRYLAKFSLFYKNFDQSSLVDPMPFHAMSAYPYPTTESFPSDPAHDKYRYLYNTRTYSR